MSEVATTEQNELVEIETPVNDSTAMILMIERAVLNPAVDVDKFERLMAMQERVMERNAIVDFNNAMAASQSEMGPIAMNKENSQTHSRYADLDAISKAIKPVYTRHGLVMSFGSDVSPMDDHYRITCCVSHTGGYSKNYHADIPSDGVGLKGTANKTKVHAFGSTMTYGRRYLTMLIFDIQTGVDDDGNQNSAPKIITAAQVKELRLGIDDLNVDIPTFLNAYQAGSLDNFPVVQYEKALNALIAKKNKRNMEAAKNG